MTDDKPMLLRFLREMLRIRRVEERIADRYPREEMRTPTHLSIGQEAVSVGVCACLEDDDAVCASHRSHAAYLARGGDLREMMAELFGRATGASRGRAGSAHLSTVERNCFSAPILGAMPPVAVGAALSFRLDRTKNVAVAFLGDAAVEEGAVMESMNFASLHRLPVLFVCENNFFSTATHIRDRQPPSPINRRMRAFGLPTAHVNGMDVVKVNELAGLFVEGARRGRGPAFMECQTYRYREHVGPNYDWENPYRTREEVQAWMRRCPIARLRRRLRRDGAFDDTAFEKMREEIDREIDEAFAFAESSPWPAASELLAGVQ